MPVVTAGPGSITIQFAAQDPADTYQVTVSDGPTPVNPFSAPHAANGTESYSIPNKGTTSNLQAGTYTVKISDPHQKVIGTYHETVMGALSRRS